MAPFDYISVVLSVIIGLGLSHLLQGYVELVQARGNVRFYWIHTAWTLLTFVGIVFLWWSIYGLHTLRVWNFPSFLLLLLEPVLMFIAAAFLVPRRKDDNESIDLRVHYFQNRRGIFGAYTLFVLLLMLQNALLNGHLWVSADAYLVGAAVVTGTAAVTDRPWYHGAAAVALLAWLVVFMVAFQMLRLRG